MSTEQNKAVVRRFVDVGLRLQDPHLDELLAPGYLNHLVPGARGALKRFLGIMRSNYPDLKFQGTVQCVIAEEDYVAVHSASPTPKLWKIGPLVAVICSNRSG